MEGRRNRISGSLPLDSGPAVALQPHLQRTESCAHQCLQRPDDSLDSEELSCRQRVAHRQAFVAPRHTINGEKVSLDTIENRLRNLGDPRVHAVLVCAARSCPPLRREAYVAARLEEQMDDSARAWLASKALNEFQPEERHAIVSSIFKWFRQDFERNGQSVEQFLAKFAPADQRAFLREGPIKLKYETYHWGLNDTSSLGEDYSEVDFLWDWFRNRK